MSSHVFHEIYLHLNWHVKDSRPTLVEPIEAAVHRFLADRCRWMKGVFLHGINGTKDHVHLAVNIEPSVSISEMVQELKGGSSHDTNTHFGEKLLQWQRGYGVVSFGKNNLNWVLKYIAGQKEHHATGKIFERLERVWVDEKDTAVAGMSEDVTRSPAEAG